MQQVTRGKGHLESFLARQRAKMANKKIPKQARQGRICDIGCGSYPYFLVTTKFAEKYGVDQLDNSVTLENVKIYSQNINNEEVLPFEDNFFDIVTMLAVAEHVEPDKLSFLFHDICRILKPEGKLVLTTPLPWADPVLKVLTVLGLVSAVEIEEHKDYYTGKKMTSLLQECGFAQNKIRYGYFELFFNLWVTATK